MQVSVCICNQDGCNELLGDFSSATFPSPTAAILIASLIIPYLSTMKIVFVWGSQWTVGVRRFLFCNFSPSFYLNPLVRTWWPTKMYLLSLCWPMASGSHWLAKGSNFLFSANTVCLFEVCLLYHVDQHLSHSFFSLSTALARSLSVSASSRYRLVHDL